MCVYVCVFVIEKRGVVEEEETQDMLLKKTERNRKRRLQAIKRREKHKVIIFM